MDKTPAASGTKNTLKIEGEDNKPRAAVVQTMSVSGYAGS